MNPRRSKMHILVDILRVIHRKNGKAKPTHILYGANLSHIRLKKFLNLLLERGFIDTVNERDHMFYIITPRGYEFLREFRKIEEFSNAFGMPL